MLQESELQTGMSVTATEDILYPSGDVRVKINTHGYLISASLTAAATVTVKFQGESYPTKCTLSQIKKRTEWAG